MSVSEKSVALQRSDDRRILAGEANAIAHVKECSLAVEAVRQQVNAGATWPGALAGPTREYNEAVLQVSACNAARKRLKDTAADEDRRKHYDDKRALVAANGALTAMESELPDATAAVVARQEEFTKLKSFSLTLHPTDKLSNDETERGHNRDIRCAENRLTDSKWNVQKLEADIAAKRSEISKLESLVTDNERRLIES